MCGLEWKYYSFNCMFDFISSWDSHLLLKLLKDSDSIYFQKCRKQIRGTQSDDKGRKNNIMKTVKDAITRKDKALWFKTLSDLKSTGSINTHWHFD